MIIDADTVKEIARNLRKWADALDIPSGDFANLDCRAAADALEMQAQQLVAKDVVIARLRGILTEIDERLERARATLAGEGI